MGLVTASLRTSRAARVRGRALQRDRRTRSATKTTRVAKGVMAGTSGAGDGRDGRRRGMLDQSLTDTRGEGRDVKTTGGARARRGVLVSAGGYAPPPTMQMTTGGAETSRGFKLRTDRKTPVSCRAWAEWRDPMAAGCVSVCTNGMMRSATVGEQEGARCENSAGASVYLLMEKAGGYSDRGGRCRDAMGCSSQRDGALLWLSEVGSQHGWGDRSATADGIGHSAGQ